MELKPGLRLESATCDTQVVVVKAPRDAGDVDLRCGGEPMRELGTSADRLQIAGGDGTPGGAADPTLLGKRYADDDLGLVVGEAERLSRLVNQVLDMAKIESGHAEWHNSDIDLRALVLQAVQTTAELFRERGARVDLDLPEQVPLLREDADLGVEVLCTQGGAGSLTIGDAPLLVKGAKPLPSSD